MLARLSTPAKLSYHIDTFNRDRSALSWIFLWMLDFIATNFQFTVSSLAQQWHNENNLLHFAEVQQNFINMYCYVSYNALTRLYRNCSVVLLLVHRYRILLASLMVLPGVYVGQYATSKYSIVGINGTT